MGAIKGVLGGGWWVVKGGRTDPSSTVRLFTAIHLASTRSLCIVSSAKCAMQETKQPHAACNLSLPLSLAPCHSELTALALCQAK